MNVSPSAGDIDAHPTLDLASRLARAGDPIQAHAIACELYELSKANDDQRLQAESADLLAECCVMTAQYEQGIGFARNARLLWETQGNVVRQAGATSILAKLLAWIGEPDAVNVASEALEMAEHTGDPRQIVSALHATGLVLSILQQPVQALSFAERAVALSRSGGSASAVALSDLGDILVCRALAARAGRLDEPGGEAFADDVARALVLTWEARAIAHGEGDGWIERLAINNIAEYSLHVGDTATADHVLRAFEDTAGVPTPRCRVHHLSVKGRTLVAQGRVREAVATFMDCLAVARETDDLEFGMRCHLDLSDAQVELGDFKAALASHRSYHDMFVRHASEAARRRARLYAVQKEMEALRATAAHATSVADELATHNLRLAHEAEALARSSLEDPLTGLPNRRRWDAAITATRTLSFAIAVIDVDHFKQVNDRFSHSVGDAVLREVGRLLGDNARREDLVVRYGGEEFTVLMHDIDAAAAERTCQRLRLLVQDHDWAAVHPGLALTISVGVAASDEADTPGAVMHLADLRLYAAKHSGRNRVVAATV